MLGIAPSEHKQLNGRRWLSFCPVIPALSYPQLSVHTQPECRDATMLGCHRALSAQAVCFALYSPQEAFLSLTVAVMQLLGTKSPACGNPGKEVNLGETVISSVILIN